MKNTKIDYKEPNIESIPGHRGFSRRKRRLSQTMACLLATLVLGLSFATPVLAEGHSATVFLSLSNETLNIGKTYTLTLKMTPNANISVNNFGAKIQYDTNKLEVVMASGTDAKFTRPSGVPSTFIMNASVTGNLINILATDQNSAQIPTNGKETSLITLSFKVKDTASTGTTSFSILDCNIDELVSNIPTSILLSITTPKTATVAARLDTNANLSELKTDIGTLSPAFSKTVTGYALDVAVDKTAVVVTAKTESPLAKIAIAGGNNLAYGKNKVTITVTAQDPDFVKVYTITVNRLSPIISSATESSSEQISASSESMSEEESMMSSESNSSSASFSVSSSTSSSEPADPTKAALQFWKLIAFLFIGLFAVTAAALLWLLLSKLRNRGNVVKKVRNNDEVVKIKRL